MKIPMTLVLDLIFGIHGKLYFIPQYGQKANIDRFFKEPILMRSEVDFGVTDKGVDNIHFLAKTVWSAYYRQNITRDPAGEAPDIVSLWALLLHLSISNMTLVSLKTGLVLCMCLVLLWNSLLFIALAMFA